MARIWREFNLDGDTMVDVFSSRIQDIPVLAEFAAGLAILAAILALLLLAYGIFLVARRIIVGSLQKFFAGSASRHDNLLVEHKVFQRLSHLAPAIFLNVFAPEVFEDLPEMASFVENASLVYTTLAIVFFVDALIDALLGIYNTYDVSRDIPLTSLVQASKLLVYFIGFVLILSLALGESLNSLLAALGALAAGAAFVFKDTILGFVAGFQLTSNSMVSVGDWIEAPDLGVDGDVLEIGITTVKVRNFDRTITFVPTYSLVSGSFKNWRGMNETGGRRIKRSVLIDVSTVKFCDAGMLERLSQITLLAGYLKEKQKEIAAHNDSLKINHQCLINGRRLTNIGVFRAYLEAYLRNHPNIRTDLTFLVRQLQPEAEGLPLEIYAFTDMTEWRAYERVQAEIFDHILAGIHEFELSIAQVAAEPDVKAA